MSEHESPDPRELLKAMLEHPNTIVMVDESGRIRLAYEDEPVPARPDS